jgi:hypothetical protein
MQEYEAKTNDFIDWSKELWFALFFLTTGFTIWPLMVYFLGQALGFEYFTGMHLRTWAESKVYFLANDGFVRPMTRLLFLCSPYLLSLLVRFGLFFSRKSE